MPTRSEQDDPELGTVKIQDSSAQSNLDFAYLPLVEQCPRGFPRLAAFLDTDENFMLYRRFGFLQARTLLYKQDELRVLENKLDRLDKVDAGSNANMLLCRDHDNAERIGLMRQIETNFKEYGENPPMLVEMFKLILCSAAPRSCPRSCSLWPTPGYRLLEYPELLRSKSSPS